MKRLLFALTVFLIVPVPVLAQRAQPAPRAVPRAAPRQAVPRTAPRSMPQMSPRTYSYPYQSYYRPYYGYYGNYYGGYGYGGYGYGYGRYGYGYGVPFWRSYTTGLKFNLGLVSKDEQEMVKRGVVSVDGAEIGIVDRHDSFGNSAIPVAPGGHQVVVQFEDGRVFQTEVFVQPYQVLHVYLRFPKP